MENPLLSVIIPVYNAQLTLRQCVDSILAQGFGNYEVILVNDGSNDDSRQICEEYAKADKRIVVINQENLGVSAARNAGLDICKGKYISFVDSDDYLNPHFFDGVNGFSDDIIFLEFVSLWQGKLIKNVPLNKGVSSMKSFLENYIDTPYIKSPWSKVIKRSKIDTLRFDNAMRIGEDTYFMYSLLSNIETFSISYHGEYIVRCPTEELSSKYSISVKYATESLNKIFNAFQKLVPVFDISRGLFLPTIQFFKYISHADLKHHSSNWYGNDEIRQLYKYVWPDLSFKQKFFLIVSFILRA